MAVEISPIGKALEGRRAWAIAVALIGVFGLLGFALRYSFLSLADVRFTRELQEVDSPWLTRAMLVVTSLGNAPVLVAIGFGSAILALLWGRARVAFLIGMSLVGLPANVLLKAIWNRARPDESLVTVAVRASGASFPSGHAMAGTMVYGALAALAWIHLPKGGIRSVVAGTFVVLPLAIDASRVYLGAHWLSDVVAGTAVGLGLLVPLLHGYVRTLGRDERETGGLADGATV